MKLKTLYLRNFRNYEEAVAHFDLGINLIKGDNGSGKTNLLEAIFFLSTGRSFRTIHLKEMIHYNASSFYLEAHFIKDNVNQTLKLNFDGVSHKFFYNHTQFNHYSHLLGVLPSVLYAPKDIGLITGIPSERRRFLNLQIAQSDPLYVHHLIRYTKAMKQRNTLLKNKSIVSIEIWEHEMAKSATYLMKKRLQTINHLNQYSSKYAIKLTDNSDYFDIAYKPSLTVDTVDHILKVYENQRHKELLYGSTLLGPHRDDFSILLENREAKAFSSEGQKRSYLAALRLAEWELIKNHSNTAPIMSIDDFAIHLDKNRHRLMQTLLKDLNQVFITTPFSNNTHVDHNLLVKNGCIT